MDRAVGYGPGIIDTLDGIESVFIDFLLSDLIDSSKLTFSIHKNINPYEYVYSFLYIWPRIQVIGSTT